MTPRVAFFTDSFHEVNGVAHTSRQFDAYVRQRSLPYLSVHAGSRTELRQDGAVWTLDLERGAAKFRLEADLYYDLLLLRHRRTVSHILKRFNPDLVHITGPSDIGMLGLLLAREHKLPVIASWHTNIHQFGALRLIKMLSFLPRGTRARISRFTENQIILALSIEYYKLARVLLAPNPELLHLLRQRTGRPTFLMRRGVDTDLFSPEKRIRSGDALVIGYVGRLSPEKSVRTLRLVEKLLLAAGIPNFRFVIVGHGCDREWLQTNLRNVELTGVLRGEELAKVYANMDLFAFPSMTDSYGNVVLEALASGVPAVVTSSGGPKFLVSDGVTGLVSHDAAHFAENVLRLARDRDARERMRLNARDFALRLDWCSVFEQLYEAYEYCLQAARAPALSLVVE